MTEIMKTPTGIVHRIYDRHFPNNNEMDYVKFQNVEIEIAKVAINTGNYFRKNFHPRCNPEYYCSACNFFVD